MTITLTDIPAAVRDYLREHVTVLVSTVRADSGSLNPGEEGTFTLTATNAGDPNGVRLINVVYHLESSDPGVMKLKVPSGAAVAPRGSLDRTAPQLTRGSLVDEMFLTFTFGILEVAEANELTLEVVGIDEGSAAITCHVHAEIDEEALFASKLGTRVERTVTVR